MSWASLAAKPKLDKKDDIKTENLPEPKTCAVLDANALISGGNINIFRLAEKLYTIQEVFDEIKDKQSRQHLQSLPFTVEVKDYTEDSLKAVTQFARETGDIHALSAADLKLLALCHTMEMAAHGSAHLKEHPMQAAMRSKLRSKGRALPGWGNVANPEGWKVVDEASHDTPHHGVSRIRSDVQSLEQTGPAEGQQPQGGNQGQGEAIQPQLQQPSADESAPRVFRTFGEAATAAVAQQQQQQREQQPQQGTGQLSHSGGLEGDAAAQALAGLSLSSELGQEVGSRFSGRGPQAGGLVDGMKGSFDGSSNDDDGDEWATVGKSKNAVRRKNRRHRQYLAREEVRAVHARAVEQEKQQRKLAAELQKQQQQAQQQGASQQQQRTQQQIEQEGQASQQPQQQGDTSSDSCSASEEDSEDEGQEGGVTCSNDPGVGENSSLFNSTSNVLCVTADFAMQNVLLQMGLRLVAQDGRQITRVSRWALRCVACFFVTKEAGRLFCPRCGNAALERVEVTVSPEGTEFFGVKKKHVLRGTRYSLPKPKGGRASNPILREDQMLKKVRRRIKQEEAAIDPFAPEFGNDTWHLGGKMQAGTDPSKGAAFLLAGWKHNPNERRSNRNRK